MKKLAIISFFILNFINFIYPNKTVLITGGTGYIGSATVLYMLQKGYNVIVLDKKEFQSNFFLKTKKINRCNLKNIENFGEKLINRVILIKSDYSDVEVLNFVFTNYDIDTVIHFAGFIEVGLSVKDPARFYQNNVVKTLTLLDNMREHNIKKLIFSSSAAVYGIPEIKEIGESTLKLPINPYGKTKLVTEMIIEDYAASYDMQSVCLRYFNAAGALPEYDIGERHEPETHLIPLLLKAAYNDAEFNIFGTDYPTPDGTCIRDYLHIQDLAEAHYLAVEYLNNHKIKFEVFNLGTNKGYSVKQVIECVEKATGKKIKVNYANRRKGDPSALVANTAKSKKVLNWIPKMSSIEKIIATSNEFFRRHFI